MLLQEVKPAEMMHYPQYPEVEKSSERLVKGSRQPAHIGYANSRSPAVSGFAETGNLTPLDQSRHAEHQTT